MFDCQQSGCEHPAQQRICWLRGDEMEIKFWYVLLVRFSEWVKKVDLLKWKKEWAEMNESQRDRYNYVLENYNGFFKK